ncbi:uncharacterized protein CANTADRAFT_27267 [Suhomyces tanzawaensis NRRL Y-17324]|uniref:Cap-associated protein CAF20 n=1 Tax=Suhomyces tanzawaensis NRRL Y-17324 TaxID=984487 RepID=A0A1E4SD57_9ASCO|nr:uncharacterized protein CANTADRAFT_27267 [Suhomyces tanzawaensis NRRL Y-17324]ODV77449.1 hypothetical protein CANTADRAFT_27267 [Suhomyces tanzawaensis NRRL Y-17324]
MAKYTEEQLIELKEEAYVPQEGILEAFNQMVEQVREHAAAEYEKHKSIKWGNGDTYIDENGNERSYNHLNRRRASRSSGNKNPRKKTGEQQVDEDGWATFSKAKKSFGAEDEDDRQSFRQAVKDGLIGPNNAVRVKPNNKNLGSSKAVDPRDAIADKHTNTFNAFEALGDDDDDE